MTLAPKRPDALRALAISHVAFEDLGSLAPVLAARGFEIETREACTLDWTQLDPVAPELAVILGGPVGVYESANYPWMAQELPWLQQRLAAKRPTLGICLGAQLMAAALGARVYPGNQGKEIGWAPLEAGEDAAAYPFAAPLLAPGLQLLHWHGDTFDLPPQALHLARSARYRNQGFILGRHALGLQFHPEVTTLALERWYVGHACELAQIRQDIPALRAASHRHGPALEHAAREFWVRWLDWTLFTARLPACGVAPKIAL